LTEGLTDIQKKKGKRGKKARHPAKEQGERVMGTVTGTNRGNIQYSDRSGMSNERGEARGGRGCIKSGSDTGWE